MSTMHVYNKVKRVLSLTAAAVVALLLAACDDGAHLGEYPLPEGQGAMVVGLESRAGVSGVALYLFGDGGATALHKSYDDPRGLASEYFPLRAGSYTVIVVANAGGAALPEDTTVPDLVEWLKAHTADFPYMLTASEQVGAGGGGIGRHRAAAPGADGRHKRHPPFHGAPRAHCAGA